MKKHIITLIAVAIISEIIAIIGVLTLFSYWLGNETVANAGSINPVSSAGNHYANYGNNNTLYNIKAYVSLSEDIVAIKESVKLDIVYSVPFDSSVSSGNTGKFGDDNKTGTAEYPADNDDIDDNDDISSVNYPAGNEINNTIYLYIPSINVANTTIKNIYMENMYSEIIPIRNWEINGLVLEIRTIPDKHRDKLQANGHSYIHIEYEIRLNKNTGTISNSNNQILLANFLITPAVYKGDKPILLYNSGFGDPYVYESNNYYVVFNIDKNMEVFAPGEKIVQNYDYDYDYDYDSNNDNYNDNYNDISSVEKFKPGNNVHFDEGMQKIIFKADNLRDFPVVITKNIKGNSLDDSIYIEKVNDTEIYFINSKYAVKYVKEAFSFANMKIGPYPYKKLFVVKASIPLQGMEFSNMVFIADRCFNDKQDLKRILYHEIFHQWFYGIIGTDQVNEPFMDEGIVNYLAIILNGDKLNSNYNNEFFNKELRDYASKDEYYHLAYIDAATYFSNIHKELGNNFYKLLQKIYKEKKFSIIYFNEFKRYLEGYYEGCFVW